MDDLSSEAIRSLLTSLFPSTRYRLRIRPNQQALLFPEPAGNHGSMAQYSRPRTPVSAPTTVGSASIVIQISSEDKEQGISRSTRRQNSLDR